MKLIYLSGLLLILLGACQPSKKASEPSISTAEERIIHDFDYQLEQDVADDRIHGAMAAAIVKRGEVIWTQGYGWTNQQAETPINDSTLFRVGSITKSFTALLMMLLHEDGTLNMEEPVANYLPEVRQIQGYSEHSPITFLQLAQHISGLSREPDNEEAAEGTIELWEQKVLAALPNTTVQIEPGTEYRYSNIGYGILGLALARAADESYLDLVAEHILQPLGMKHSHFVVPEAQMANLAQGMEGGPFGELRLDIPAEEHAGRGYKVPNGGLYTTARDLSKFLAAYQGYSDLLAPAQVAQLHTPGLAPDSAWWQNYGMGSRLLRDSVISTAGHSGAVSGYTANFMFDTEGEYGVVTLRNYNWGMTNLDLRDFAVLRRLKLAETEL